METEMIWPNKSDIAISRTHVLKLIRTSNDSYEKKKPKQNFRL